MLILSKIIIPGNYSHIHLVCITLVSISTTSMQYTGCVIWASYNSNFVIRWKEILNFATACTLNPA